MIETAIVAIFNQLTTIALICAIPVATGFFAWGGYQWMFSGSGRNSDEGKGTVIKTALGVGIVFAAKILASQLETILRGAGLG